MAPTLVASYYVQISPQGTSALTTPSFAPSNGEVLIVKLVTWDTGSPLGAPTGGSQTYTSRVVNAPGGFNQWCAIYSAVVSGSPGSMTVSSTPSVSLRGSMVVERWSGAQLAASPVTDSSTGFSAPAASTITPTSGTSIISWCAGDANSVDPATRAYLQSATDEGVRDDHVGSNGVDLHAYNTSTGSSSQSYGLSAPTGMTYVIAAIEVQDSGGVAQATTRQPLVVSQPAPATTPAALLRRGTLTDPPVLTTRPPTVVSAPLTPSPPSVPILVRTAAAAVVAPASSSPAPYVVTGTAQTPAAAPVILVRPRPPDAATGRPIVVTAAPVMVPGAAIIARGTLADPPVLTTPSPRVVTAAPPPPAATAILVRNAQPDAPPVTGPTVVPIVVTAPTPPPGATIRTLRAHLQDVVIATSSPQVVTSPVPVRPSPPILARGSLVDFYAGTEPLVVTKPAREPIGSAWLIRNPQPGIAPVPGPTTAPIVVTAVRPAPPGLTVLIRGAGGECDCVIARPSAAPVPCPSTGPVARPSAAAVPRPCGCH